MEINRIIKEDYLKVQNEVVECDLALLEEDGWEGRAVAVQASAQRNVDVGQKTSAKIWVVETSLSVCNK